MANNRMIVDVVRPTHGCSGAQLALEIGAAKLVYMFTEEDVGSDCDEWHLLLIPTNCSMCMPGRLFGAMQGVKDRSILLASDDIADYLAWVHVDYCPWCGLKLQGLPGRPFYDELYGDHP